MMVGIRKQDILLGRGPARYNHPGNETFRRFLRVHVSCYEKEATHREKRAMVQHLISEFQEKRRCRFLRLCSKRGSWVQAPLHQIKIKIAHGLRDARLQELDDENKYNSQKNRTNIQRSTSDREDRFGKKNLVVPHMHRKLVPECEREFTFPTKNLARTPSQPSRVLVPDIDVLNTTHCSQRQAFVNMVRHNGSERLPSPQCDAAERALFGSESQQWDTEQPVSSQRATEEPALSRRESSQWNKPSLLRSESSQWDTDEPASFGSESPQWETEEPQRFRNESSQRNTEVLTPDICARRASCMNQLHDSNNTERNFTGLESSFPFYPLEESFSLFPPQFDEEDANILTRLLQL